MATAVNPSGLNETSVLLRGETESIAGWMERWDNRRFATQVMVIVLGAGCYGAAMGWWRGPEQALYVAIKFPLIILLTMGGNALINGMLAPLLGLNIPFRQSFSAILMSSVVAAVILGAFSPLMAFLVWNVPPISTAMVHSATYGFVKLANVAVIAFAGCAGNARLFQLLVRLAGSRAVALRVLLAWLAGNLFLGSQLSWILRPFIGLPGLPVQFLRDNAFQGNFYENVFHTFNETFLDFD
jgi:hypothetical protein